MILRHGVMVVLIVLAGAAVLALGARLQGPALRGALLGALLAAAGSMVGATIMARASRGGARRFYGGVAAGILARFLLFLGVLIGIGLARPAGLPLAAVALSLLGFFFVFQALEVRLVMRRSIGGGA